MKPDQVPTVFVALLLEDGQHDLFEEIKEEASIVLGEWDIEKLSGTRDGERLMYLDGDCLRLTLSWQTLPLGDVLTVAVGAQPDRVVPADQARGAADMLRDLVQRAEALFEVHRALWQISTLPLNANALARHGDQLGTLERDYSSHSNPPFISFEPRPCQIGARASNQDQGEGLLSNFLTAIDAANEEPSWAMQASALAVSTTFVLVAPPVGVALFTYAALRQGSEMELLPATTNTAISNPVHA